MTYSAFLDACVLVPINLTDVLLRLANVHAFRPLWSDQVLEEVRRNLPAATPNVSPAKAAKRVATMRDAFPAALVTNYEWMIPEIRNHPKDRHVLAAAVQGDAKVLVTANLADFSLPALREHGVRPLHPDDFLGGILENDPDLIANCLQDLVLNRRRPPETLEAFLIQLGKLVPRFADSAQRLPLLRWS